jgi:hypothetical protein
MRKTTFPFVLLLLLLVGVWSCIDPFAPPEINNTRQYLVFDGFVNTNGTDTSWFMLSATQNLNDPSRPSYQMDATLSVEGDKGVTYPFSPHPSLPGTYFRAPEAFDLSQNYRLNILLNGNHYQTDWQKFQASPPIDSVTYEIKNGEGVQIYVHTHDPSNASKFYKWSFEETWEYHAPLFSSLEVIGRSIVDRVVPINRCWSSATATNINLFTTANLSRDLVAYHPINYVSAATNKLLYGYSILVHQQVLSREGFDYFNELAKNNETNGSIFDPFPSQLTGNIHCLTDPDEKVFGFFRGGTVQSQRIFIREYLGRGPQCFQVDTLTRAEVFESGNLIAYELPEMPLNYVTAAPFCLDCREMGGTILRPWFWR